MRIAIIQMCSGGDVAENLRRAGRLVSRAAEWGAELLALPEYFCLMGHRAQDKLAVAESPGHGPIQDWLAQTASRLGLWLAGGSLPLVSLDPQRVYNSSLVYGPDGRCQARYDKMHLFSYDDGQRRFDEGRTQLAGDLPAILELPSRDGHLWRIGLSICYDLRFPELYRHHAAAGAELLLAPSAFTYATGKAHWQILLQARAIENLCFMAAAAQGGRHDNGRQTWGHSLILDPWGKKLAERQRAGAGVITADLDIRALQDLRRQLPALQHRHHLENR